MSAKEKGFCRYYPSLSFVASHMQLLAEASGLCGVHNFFFFGGGEMKGD